MICRPAAVLSAVALLALAACSTQAPTVSAPRPSGTPASANPGTASCRYEPDGDPAKPVDPPSGTNVPATGTSTVTLDLGDARLPIELDRAAAPCTVHSFESLASQGFYDGTSCHRLSTQGLFMLQCGDPTGSGQGGPGYRFADELERTSQYPAGTVAMANAGPDTNGSQFFLVFEDSPLPPNYTVFGRLSAEGVQALKDRAFQGHDSSWPDGTGRPNAPTVIRSVTAG